MAITLVFPDGSKKDYEIGVTALEIAKQISNSLAKKVIAASIDNSLIDLNRPIESSGSFKLVTFDDKEGREVFWHSSSHILAHAVKNLFPEAKLAIGPSIEEGFYYDFDVDVAFTPEDLKRIEAEMKKIVKQKLAFERQELGPEEANSLFKEEPYKLEMIKGLDSISIYRNNGFYDLCRGPHILNTSMVKGLRLIKVSGAYWKGSSDNRQLQRIYGISFPSEKMLEDHLKMVEEAEKRDHRKLGKELELFSFHEESPGCAFFLPKGVILKNLLIDLWRREHKKQGYIEIQTPIILSRTLWETSGHWDNYKENMYTLKIDDKDFAVKPMNCPGGMLVFKERAYSYKELPLKVGELGLVHRHELSGVLSGLFRVRCFTQDDAHIFMMPSQAKDEVKNVVHLIDRFYRLFSLSYHIELSTRPEKSIGNDEQWENAERYLKEALEELNLSYKINEGDGAFYGPKIDFHIKDSIGRTWQCATIQLDMSLPERFDLTYIGEDSKKHRPVMIHRVIYGALERFIGILTEHYAGKFPFWLSPVQLRIITVADRFSAYAEKLKYELEENSFRVELDARSESVSYKIRDAQLKKIPYILVVGEKEEKNSTVNIRTRDNEVLGESSLKDLIARCNEDMKKVL